MAIVPATLINLNFVLPQGNYVSPLPIAAGIYNEMLLVWKGAATGNITFSLVAIDPQGVDVDIWNANESAGAFFEAVDIGVNSAYQCTRSWGQLVKVQITVTGAATWTGSLTLQAKG